MWDRVHKAMKRAGLDKMADDEIEAEIQAARYRDDSNRLHMAR